MQQTEYRVAKAIDIASLEVQVNALLADGWNLAGTLVAIEGEGVPSHLQYLQPMVKYPWMQASTTAEYDMAQADKELAQVNQAGTYASFLAGTGKI